MKQGVSSEERFLASAAYRAGISLLGCPFEIGSLLYARRLGHRSVSTA